MIECLAALGLIVPFLCLIYEATKREVLDINIQHVACLAARQKGLGKSVNQVRREIKNELERLVGKSLGAWLFNHLEIHLYTLSDPQQLRWLELGNQTGSVAEFFIRYPQLLSFQKSKQRKHHQEIIRRCLFPLSLAV